MTCFNLIRAESRKHLNVPLVSNRPKLCMFQGGGIIQWTVPAAAAAGTCRSLMQLHNQATVHSLGTIKNVGL